jgi:hypothetical protein
MKSELISSWEQAAIDLKIKIQAPFKLTVGDKEIDCYLLVEHFGSKKGTVVLSTDNMDDLDEPEKLGFYCSALNPANYSTYERDHFIDTLNDWGFFGEKEQTPDWYKGDSWSS